ncbi:MAG: 2-hydroxychromene-2-carboxylate isomerase [Lysobacter sp.]|nr:2-hydroxychromene-2-carboxylate isomerase [Lysobacter sp.]
MTTPPTLCWYFDFISPFAYLHWRKIRTLATQQPVELVPILFAAVLNAHGQKGPAEIPGKREFTYRHVLWQARREGIALRFPPAHPFNPIPALRLCIAAGTTPAAIDAIYRWIWAEGRAADSAEALAPVNAALGVDPAMLANETVKATLRSNTDAALGAGVFGVPTLLVGDTLFWGNDVHAFALEALHDPALLDDAEMRRIASLQVAVHR